MRTDRVERPDRSPSRGVALGLVGTAQEGMDQMSFFGRVKTTGGAERKPDTLA